ncbi:MAG: hypothetical protein ACQES5_01820 [Thermodesulfobacteriota bacterium]
MVNKKGSEKQSMEELTERYKKLDREKTTTEANLKMAKDRLEELQKEAREQYGTDDPEELKRLLEQMEEENERKRSEYQQLLDKVENDLRAVKESFANGFASENEE